MNRREVLKSTFGALALASGIGQNGVAQTRRRAVGRGPGTAAATPDYARLSNAVLNSHGLAAASVWIGTNTGTLKSDDLVRASLLLRLTADHFEEIGANSYVNTQLSQPPPATIPPDVAHAIGGQFQPYGILLTDAQIQSMYPSDPNVRERVRVYAAQVGIRGVQVQIADSIDLAAKKLRLQEIATACGALLPLLPSSQSHLTPVDNTFCSDWQARINAVVLAATLLAASGYLGCVPCVGLAFGMFIAAAEQQVEWQQSCGR